MKKRTVIILTLSAVVLLSLALVAGASAVSGAAFTTANPWVDGLFKEVCKNSLINCNIYGTKPDVWLNGGPAANGLGPDGQYFFAVLVPGGQPDPNDGGAKNLSDDFDAYTNREFTVTNGEVSFYGGTHDQDSGDTLDASRPYCSSPRGCTPDGSPPFIRLFPYADTTNPGGVYILAICSLERGYPVEPRDCKYDAFKVKHGTANPEFMLQGMKFKDFAPHGVKSYPDYGLAGWTITITGTGFTGESINTSVTTGDGGFWNFGKTYTVGKTDPLYTAQLHVCEVQQDYMTQTFPSDGYCYDVSIDPAGVSFVGELDFGNFLTYYLP